MVGNILFILEYDISPVFILSHKWWQLIQWQGDYGRSGKAIIKARNFKVKEDHNIH